MVGEESAREKDGSRDFQEICREIKCKGHSTISNASNSALELLSGVKTVASTAAVAMNDDCSEVSTTGVETVRGKRKAVNALVRQLIPLHGSAKLLYEGVFAEMNEGLAQEENMSVR